MDAIQTIKHEGFTIEIHADENPMNPRTECDNLGTMVCFHNRYLLGDKHSYNQGDYNSWSELESAIMKDNDIAVILPLYLFDHSGITMNTTGFSCPWDSGQVGFIFISKEKAKFEYSAKIVSKHLKARLKKYLECEVEIYDKYLRGESYGYVVLDKDGDETDSCWGYFEIDTAIEDAKSCASAFCC